MSGYILESKDILNSAIWHKPPLYFKVWHYLLIRAQFQDYKGLKRGQLITSINEIRDACSYKVGFRIEKPSAKQIRGILDFLRFPDEVVCEGECEGAMIVTTKVANGILVTICNYNVYQDFKTYDGNCDGSTMVTMTDARRDEEGHNYKRINNNKTNKESKKDIYTSETAEIIRYLNERIGSRYRSSTPKTKDLIHARLKEGFTVEDFKTVIDKKADEWMGDTKMQKFLRPETLFSNKFEGYLNQPNTRRTSVFDIDF